jgi:hypothetical protein
MPSTKWLAPLVARPWVRRFADAVMVRASNRRVKQLDQLDAAAAQERTLLKLVRKAEETRFGKEHKFATIRSVKEYQDLVPIRDYEAFWKGYWKDAYPTLDNITWPGKIPYYALSSGTTSGTTKYIPISREMLKSNQKAAFTTTAFFRHSNPDAKLLTGKFLFLGGSTNLRSQQDGSLAGDLSGIAAKEILEALRPYTFPPLDIALLSDWEVKLERLAQQAIREPITAISGVPSWMLILFDRVKKISGKRSLIEIWPQLKLIVHGGTKFDQYRELFRSECGSSAIQFCEVYPCSEGFIATEDPRHKLLRIVPDHGLFYEFIPWECFDDHGKLKPNPVRHTLRNAEVGVRYAVLVTSCAGVWSYLLGDTISFEQINPPLIRFTGRTKNFLSAFGEHLIEEEVELAVAHAAKACGVNTVDHHVGPIFPTDPKKPGHHLYLIEFRGAPPENLTKFATLIDDELIRLNEDYAAHRVGDLTMLRPEVRPVPPGGFEGWMKSRGKFGGQNKVPRMDNNGTITLQISDWLSQM